jgi:hypothetical protein
LSAVPQLFAPHAVAFDLGVQPHLLATPPPLQVSGRVHPPQLYVPLQPFDTVPHLPEQAVDCAVGVQPHMLATPPPLQVCGNVQPPQSYLPPQPFDTWPHFPEQAVL